MRENMSDDDLLKEFCRAIGVDPDQFIEVKERVEAKAARLHAQTPMDDEMVEAYLAHWVPTLYPTPTSFEQ